MRFSKNQIRIISIVIAASLILTIAIGIVGSFESLFWYLHNRFYKKNTDAPLKKSVYRVFSCIFP